MTDASGARFLGWGTPRLWALAAVTFGLICRVRQYLANTSLWHDESFVALNVLHTPYTDLLGARDWHEPSPPGFLLIEKLVVAALGPTEQAFRLVPHLAGLLALIGFAAFARRITGGGSSWAWAVAVFSMSATLIDQTNLVKHFSFDLSFAIAFAWLALRAHDAAEPRQTLYAWGALATIAPWLSYASVFSVAASSVLLGASRLRGWNTMQRRAYLQAHIPVLLSCAFLLVPIRMQRTGTVVAFWSGGFPDTQSLSHLSYWLIRTHLGLYHYLVQPVRGLGPPFALAGALYCWRHERRFALILLWLPIGLALVASSLHYWPFGGNQHMSFAAPAVMITVAIGIDRFCTALREWPPLVLSPAGRGRFAGALLLGPALLLCLYHLAVPRRRHEMRPVIQYAQQHRAADDRMIVLDAASYFFYTGVDVRTQSLQIGAAQRLWIVTPTSKRGELAPDGQRIVDAFAQRRRRLDLFQAHGAATYLFGAEGEPPRS